MKVILILGSGHCGSTLLDMLLGAHSQITGVGEIQQLDKNVRCTCGQKPEACSFWQSVVKEPDKPMRIVRSKVDFLLNKDNFYYQKSGRSVDTKEFLERNEKMYHRILEQSQARVVVDSSKSIYRAALLDKSNEIDLTIVHLVRDGRGVTWSYYKKYHKALWFMYRWFAYNLKVELLKIRLSAPSALVLYESLAREPESELRKILNKVDLSFESQMLDFRNAEHHQVGGNRMRFRDGNKIEFDNAWKDEMPLKIKVIYNFLFGWMNEMYNYLAK